MVCIISTSVVPYYRLLIDASQSNGCHPQRYADDVTTHVISNFGQTVSEVMQAALTAVE